MGSKLKKFARLLRGLILHERLLAACIHLFELIVGNQIRKANGINSLRSVGSKGANVRFHGRVQIYDPAQLKIGSDVRVGRDCFLFCMGGLEIGDGTIISRNVTIYTANHDTYAECLPYGNEYSCKPVRIGRGVWIGMNVSIAPGVTIGDAAVIGMGTVVARDVAPGEYVVGAQARVIKERGREGTQRALDREDFFARKWPDL